VTAVRLNPDRQPQLDDIINKALEKDRDLRYQHAAEIRSDLRAEILDLLGELEQIRVTALVRLSSPITVNPQKSCSTSPSPPSV
jgi:eukaryotic-like serine/threonine-protein kinase